MNAKNLIIGKFVFAIASTQKCALQNCICTFTTCASGPAGTLYKFPALLTRFSLCDPNWFPVTVGLTSFAPKCLS